MLYTRLDEFPTYRIYENGDVLSEYKNGTSKLLKHHKRPNGYLYVVLNGKTIKNKKMMIHRLLAMCFIKCDRPFNEMTVDHINTDRTDNRLENLRWASNQLQNLNKKWKPTTTGYPFISKSGNYFRCVIRRDYKCIIQTRRLKLEDAIALIRETIINNRFILDGMPNETLSIIKEKYNIKTD